MKEILNKIGNQTISRMEIRRCPVSFLLTATLTVLSLGRFLFNNPYDKLFHLSINITTNQGVNCNIEKLEVPTITINPKREAKTETLNVPITHSMTVREFIENSKNRMGVMRFFNYSAKNNNCQDFVLSLLEANRLSNAENVTFVKQNIKQLFHQLDYLRKFSNTITDLAHRANVLMQGEGLIQNNSYCHATTQKGLPCKRKPMKNGRFCHCHSLRTLGE
jgi:hypothetical protein